MPSLKIATKLAMVSTRIKILEKAHLLPNESLRLEENQWATIHHENGKRMPVYRSTPPDLLHGQLERFLKATATDLSNVKAADLGSGFGASSVALSYFCKSVTGFELFSPYIKDARTVVNEFGYRNIRFKNKDFIEANLSKFKLWYIYFPFFDGFGRIMANKIGEASPGTTIILRSSLYPQLLGLKRTEMIYPFDKTAFSNTDFNVMKKI